MAQPGGRLGGGDASTAGPDDEDIAVEQLNFTLGSPLVRIMTAADDGLARLVEVSQVKYDPSVFVFRLPARTAVPTAE